MRREKIETIVVGGGQAGLSVGYHLARRGASFLILEAHDRIGDSWRKRWDSLRLFTPAQFDGLPGLPFPANGRAFPTKDQMADYLESYARQFKLPVQTGVRVDRLSKLGGGFLIQAGDREFLADHVVVAMADYQQPRTPKFALELDRDIVQLHSSEYRNPSQLRDGDVLVVGAANSGAELAMEFVRAGHRTWLSGNPVPEIPFDIDSLPSRLFFRQLVFRVVFHRILTTGTPMGRRARLRRAGHTVPLIRTKSKDLAAAGVNRVPRTSGVRDGRPLLEDGRVLEVSTVVWCTGYEPGFSWIDLPIFDQRGAPEHQRGVAVAEPNLSFVGLQFLYAMSSSMIHGVGRDAEYIAERIVSAKAHHGVTEETEGRTERATEIGVEYSGQLHTNEVV